MKLEDAREKAQTRNERNDAFFAEPIAVRETDMEIICSEAGRQIYNHPYLGREIGTYL